LWEAALPFTHGGAYINFLGNEGIDRVKAAYGEDKFRRLQAVNGPTTRRTCSGSTRTSPRPSAHRGACPGKIDPVVP
jgi:hypothetical protein